MEQQIQKPTSYSSGIAVTCKIFIRSKERGTTIKQQKIYLPSLHIKLGLIKVFIEALDTEGRAIIFRRKFVPVCKATLKEKNFLSNKY